MYTKKYFFLKLCNAAKSGDSDTIRVLSTYTITYSKMINDRNWNTGQTPLHIAADMNNEGAVATILKHYSVINVNQGTLHDGKTPLMIAVKHRNIKIVSHLLEYGADPNIKDLYGHTPIYDLFTDKDCYKHCINIIKEIIKYNFDINKPIDNQGNHLIHLVTIQSPSYNIAKLLLQNKANPHIKNQRDQIPLCEIPKKFNSDDANKLLKYAEYGSPIQNTYSIDSHERICAEYMNKCTLVQNLASIMYNLKWSVGYFVVTAMIMGHKYFSDHDYYERNIKFVTITTPLVPLVSGFYTYWNDQFDNCIPDT